MIIKVCGLREPDNIRQIVELKPDYMGFIFYPHSKRYAGDLGRDALDSILPSVKKTGVFVNETMDAMADAVIKYDLDAVQLHGNEQPEFCRSFIKFLHNMQTEKQVEIIKAFGVSEEFDFTVLAGYEDFIDYFLFDTLTSQHGGSGQSFNWDILNNYHGKKSYFLSGGLSLDNIQGVKEIKDARLYGVDLNSRFEIEEGVKDIVLLRRAFGVIKSDE